MKCLKTNLIDIQLHTVQYRIWISVFFTILSGSEHDSVCHAVKLMQS